MHLMRQLSNSALEIECLGESASLEELRNESTCRQGEHPEPRSRHEAKPRGRKQAVDQVALYSIASSGGAGLDDS